VSCKKLDLVHKVLIVDLDVHQGGTAFIFQNDPSLHLLDALRGQLPWYQATERSDVPLPIGMEDDAYLQTLAKYYRFTVKRQARFGAVRCWR